jgi:DNA-nicking Smr family endonuclease
VTKKNVDTLDYALFRQTIGTIQPIKNNNMAALEASKPLPYPKKNSSTILATPTDLTEQLPLLGKEDAVHFSNTSLPKTLLTKLQQGYFPVDAELDLHGLNSQEAKRHILKFIEECVTEGCQCIHIVHGKGYRSSDDFPILKNNVNLWLRQHHAVQAFCSAPQKDGGTGALYVLLETAFR